jgi:hypothetical protein
LFTWISLPPNRSKGITRFTYSLSVENKSTVQVALLQFKLEKIQLILISISKRKVSFTKRKILKFQSIKTKSSKCVFLVSKTTAYLYHSEKNRSIALSMLVVKSIKYSSTWMAHPSARIHSISKSQFWHLVMLYTLRPYGWEKVMNLRSKLKCLNHRIFSLHNLKKLNKLKQE